MMATASEPKHYLLASDFDKTLSFNDSGVVLSEILGASCYEEKVEGLATSNLVQQGGELAYLIRHDPEFRSLRREHLIEAGREVSLKRDIPELIEFLDRETEGYSFSFRVISAGPRELVQSALTDVVPPENIYGTELDYDQDTGEVEAIRRVPAGYGKVAVIEELEETLGIAPERTIYVGDGSSDVHVMLHVNNRDGFTIAVSENRHLARIAKRTVLSDSAFSILVPVLDEILDWPTAEVRALFESVGLTVEEWERVHSDKVTVGERDSSKRAVDVA